MIPYTAKHACRMAEHIKRIDAHVSLGVSGHFKITKHKVDAAGNILSTDPGEWFGNLITNAGMDMLGATTTGYIIISGCQLGKGNTPPANGDIQLGANFVAASTTQQARSITANVTVLPYYVAWSKTFRFNAGVVAAGGGIVTEVATVGNASNPMANTAPLFSHALIKDGSGNPTSITVLSDEVLDVAYELRAYPTLSSTGTFNITIDGVDTPFNYEVRPAMMGDSTYFWNWSPDNYSGNIGYIHSNYNVGGGTSGYDLGNHAQMPNQAISSEWSSVTDAVYIAGNWYRDHTFYMSLNYSNFNIKSCVMRFAPGWTFQMNFNNTLPKTASKKFNITVRVSWARYP